MDSKPLYVNGYYNEALTMEELYAMLAKERAEQEKNAK